MDIKQQILHFYRVEGLSLREISRRAGVDRKTVMRLINDYEAAIKANPETGVDDFLASRPKYSKRAYAPLSDNGRRDPLLRRVRGFFKRS